MKKTTLVIMAAGMGSRFGGIKQIEPVGPSGEILLDYSVFDGIEAGFNKVIFIIRKDIEKEFKEVIGERLEKRIEVEYVFQNMEDLPAGYVKPKERTKPWGTGHAILSCRGKVNTPFVVINADDYYGKEGFKKIHSFLCEPKECETKYNFCMAGFHLGNTLSENGTVTRGVCKVENGVLVDVEETYDIRKSGMAAKTEQKEIPFEQPVSMNMWGFTPDIMEELEKRFTSFLDGISPDDMKAEYLLPTIVDKLIKEGEATVHVLDTADKWFGVTYKEDKEYVQESFKNLVEKGVYPAKLFD
ncbi:MAG: sugar phosphate nucleotidyltransferase [Acetivibrio sp.]